ncbi:VOC family protein [Kitasatospora sp. NPDC006697]|uniref:VOC family protein n=1 Tax=Kitasatospora sp. NPDC006697 TaxID=3364020 RepID=UPI0036BC5E2D
MAGLALLVLYTARLEECREFYAGLGLPLRPERHGGSPAHYAAELPGGLVLELYPAGPGRESGPVRLGFTVPGVTERRLLTDPDGRTVELTGC